MGWKDLQYIGNVVQSRLERLSARGAREARRELRPDEDAAYRAADDTIQQ